jgi:hypothetical protein
VTVMPARPVLGARGVRTLSAMVSTPGADPIVFDGSGFGARSGIGVVPPENVLAWPMARSVGGKCTSKSHVPEFRR